MEQVKLLGFKIGVLNKDGESVLGFRYYDLPESKGILSYYLNGSQESLVVKYLSIFELFIESIGIFQGSDKVVPRMHIGKSELDWISSMDEVPEDLYTMLFDISYVKEGGQINSSIAISRDLGTGGFNMLLFDGVDMGIKFVRSIISYGLGIHDLTEFKSIRPKRGLRDSIKIRMSYGLINFVATTDPTLDIVLKDLNLARYVDNKPVEGETNSREYGIKIVEYSN